MEDTEKQLEILHTKRNVLENSLNRLRNEMAAIESAHTLMLKEYRQLEIEELRLIREKAKIVPTDILK
jgi:hypothetical protein